MKITQLDGSATSYRMELYAQLITTVQRAVLQCLSDLPGANPDEIQKITIEELEALPQSDIVTSYIAALAHKRRS